MSEIKYDENGGITNTDEKLLNNNIGKISKPKKSYNFLERLLIKYSKKVNYLLDENGKYKCRKDTAPKKISIGPTNRCTARCTYCPREHIHAGGTGYMNFGMYEKIIDWSKKNNVNTIGFSMWGEPTLHPRFIEMIDLAVGAGIEVKFSSNGIILYKELADKILDYPIYSIEISMDGFTGDEYLRGKQVDKFEQAKKNVLYLLEKAKEKKSKTVFNIHFVDVGNISFLNKFRFIKYWKSKLKGLKHATSFSYEPHNWAGTRSDIEKEMSFFDRLLASLRLRKPCIYVKGFNINWNGNVYTCGSDPTEDAIIGNINESSIEEIYAGEKRRKYLEAQEKGDFSDLNCGHCTVNQVLPLSYLKKKIINKLVNFIV